MLPDSMLLQVNSVNRFYSHILKLADLYKYFISVNFFVNKIFNLVPNHSHEEKEFLEIASLIETE